LKQQLRSIKKDFVSVNDYILKIKTISHALVAISEPLSDKDLLLAILNGLDHDYETMVSLIIYQMDDINLEKVQYLLLMHGQRLAAKNLSVSSVNFDYVASSSMNVNVASYWSRNGNGFGNNRGGFMPRGGNYQNRGGRSRGRSGGRRIYCQLCGKPGHFVDKCFH